MSNENKQEYLRSTGTCYGCCEIHFEERTLPFEKYPGYVPINEKEYNATHIDYHCNHTLPNGDRCKSMIKHCPINGQIIAEEVRCWEHKDKKREEEFKVQMQEWCEHPRKIVSFSDRCMKCVVCQKKFTR